MKNYYGTDVVNPKDSERSTRGKKFVGGDSPNVYPVWNKELPSIRLLAGFFKNNSNKERLQSFLLQEFTLLCTQRQIRMMYSVRGTCTDITAPNRNVQAYKCQKIEADNAIFYVYDQIRKSGDATPVVIEAEDTDVLITAAFVTTKICGVLGIKMKKGIFDCNQLLPRFMAEIAERCFRYRLYIKLLWDRKSDDMELDNAKLVTKPERRFSPVMRAFCDVQKPVWKRKLRKDFKLPSEKIFSVSTHP